MKNEIRDERIILSKRKIQSDGFSIVFIALMISVLVQQYLGFPVSQYIVEMVLWVSMCIYLLLFNFIKGNDLYSYKRSNSLIALQSIFTGLTIAITNVIQNYFNYGEAVQDTLIKHLFAVGIISFISATPVIFVILKVLSSINNKKQQAINNHLDDEE